MPDDPVIVAENVVLDNRRDRRFDINWTRWIAGLVLVAGGLSWTLFRTELSREPALPDRPLTKADVPLLKKKIKFLKEDADLVSDMYPHLKNKAEIHTAQLAWEEVYYTPEVFPAAKKLHHLQYPRVLEVRPELVESLRAREEYEEGRYAIANNAAFTADDKASAIANLERMPGPAVNGADYSKTAAQVKAVLPSLVGDPELDRAQQEYHNACETAILKRHPELAAFYHEVDFRDEAYHHFMAQANNLTRQMQALQNGATQAVATAVVKPMVPSAKVATPGGASSPTNALPALPEAAGRYGVKVGDRVEISALSPTVAAHHALITTMNEQQLTIKIGDDTFVVRWDKLVRLKTERKT